MKPGIFHFLSFLVLPLFINSSGFARNCACIAKTETKTYQSFSTHFWGSKRAWSCEYRCASPVGSQQIIGFHEEWYLGKDDGREGVCDGIRFENRYNNYIMDFIWIPQEPELFDPLDSSSQNLKDWADTTCRQGDPR